MPELPDVEVFRRRLAHASLHRLIEHTHVYDKSVLRDTTAHGLSQTLSGQSLERTGRRGKQLWVGVSDGRFLVLHFGMTGFVAPGVVEDPPHKHARVSLEFAGGRRVDFVDQRKLGFVTLIEDIDEHFRREELGPDALDVSRSDLRELCRSWRGGIKSLLMDQSTMAGVGNIYSDEILFQARLDPRRCSTDLDEASVGRLHRRLHRVLTTAIDRHADPAQLPASWLIQRRVDGVPCPRGNGEVRHFRSGGRGAFFCPACQR